MTVVTFSPTATTGYINTNNPVTVLQTNAAVTLNNLFLGNDIVAGGGNRLWKGNIAIASIYNRTLSQTEITQYYNTYKGRFGLT